MADIDLPLSEFWDSLEDKQRRSLLALRREHISKKVTCPSCKELLNVAINTIESGRGKSKKSSGNNKLPVLSRLADGIFIPGSQDLRKRPSTDFVTFQGGVFDLLPNPQLRSVILNAPGSSSGSKAAEAGGGDDAAASSSLIEPESCYCSEKYHVRFVDMLTYPRPIRKFQMLLSKDMKLGILREMMWAEVGLESVSMLELMVRNRRLRGDSDQKTLEELGFKNNIQVIVSQVLGQVPDDQEGVNEKNKQFVGDLLFGQSPRDPAASGGGGAGNKNGGGGGSIIETYRINGGYQVLGRTLEQAAREAVHHQWHAELKARQNERDLLASLEAEILETGEDAAKKKNKKIKKKEKEKKRKQEEAERRTQMEQDREREIQAKIKANHEKTEAERRARLEQQRLEAEAEKRRIQELMERKQREEAQRLAQEKKAQLEAKRHEEAAAAAKVRTPEQGRKQQQQQQATSQSTRQQQQQGKPSSSSIKSSPSNQQQAKVNAVTKSVQKMSVGVSSDANTKQSKAKGAVGTKANTNKAEKGAPSSSHHPHPQQHMVRGHKPSSSVGSISPPMLPHNGGGKQISPPPGQVRPPPVTVPSPYVGGDSGHLVGIPSPRGLPSPSLESSKLSHTPAASQGLVMGGLGGGVQSSPTEHQQQQLVPRFCSQCGFGLVLGSRFCSQCGHPVVIPPSSSSSTSTMPLSSPTATSPSWGGGEGGGGANKTPVGGSQSHDARVMPRSAPVTPRPQHADVSSEGGGGGPSPASSSSNLPPYLQQLRQDGGVVPEFLSSMTGSYVDAPGGGGGGGGGPGPSPSTPSPVEDHDTASSPPTTVGASGLPVFQFLRGR